MRVVSFLSLHRSTHLIASSQTHAPSLHDDSTYNIAIQTETYTTSLPILQETLLTSLHHFPSDRIYLYNVFKSSSVYVSSFTVFDATFRESETFYGIDHYPRRSLPHALTKALNNNYTYRHLKYNFRPSHDI